MQCLFFFCIVIWHLPVFVLCQLRNTRHASVQLNNNLRPFQHLHDRLPSDKDKKISVHEAENGHSFKVTTAQTVNSFSIDVATKPGHSFDHKARGSVHDVTFPSYPHQSLNSLNAVTAKVPGKTIRRKKLPRALIREVITEILKTKQFNNVTDEHVNVINSKGINKEAKFGGATKFRKSVSSRQSDLPRHGSGIVTDNKRLVLSKKTTRNRQEPGHVLHNLHNSQAFSSHQNAKSVQNYTTVPQVYQSLGETRADHHHAMSEEFSDEIVPRKILPFLKVPAVSVISSRNNLVTNSRHVQTVDQSAVFSTVTSWQRNNSSTRPLIRTSIRPTAPRSTHIRAGFSGRRSIIPRQKGTKSASLASEILQTGQRPVNPSTKPLRRLNPLSKKNRLRRIRRDVPRVHAVDTHLDIPLDGLNKDVTGTVVSLPPRVKRSLQMLSNIDTESLLSPDEIALEDSSPDSDDWKTTLQDILERQTSPDERGTDQADNLYSYERSQVKRRGAEHYVDPFVKLFIENEDPDFAASETLTLEEEPLTRISQQNRVDLHIPENTQHVEDNRYMTAPEAITMYDNVPVAIKTHDNAFINITRNDNASSAFTTVHKDSIAVTHQRNYLESLDLDADLNAATEQSSQGPDLSLFPGPESDPAMNSDSYPHSKKDLSKSEQTQLSQAKAGPTKEPFGSLTDISQQTISSQKMPSTLSKPLDREKLSDLKRQSELKRNSNLEKPSNLDRSSNKMRPSNLKTATNPTKPSNIKMASGPEKPTKPETPSNLHSNRDRTFSLNRSSGQSPRRGTEDAGKIRRNLDHTTDSISLQDTVQMYDVVFDKIIRDTRIDPKDLVIDDRELDDIVGLRIKRVADSDSDGKGDKSDSDSVPPQSGTASEPGEKRKKGSKDDFQDMIKDVNIDDINEVIQDVKFDDEDEDGNEINDKDKNKDGDDDNSDEVSLRIKRNNNHDHDKNRDDSDLRLKRSNDDKDDFNDGDDADELNLRLKRSNNDNDEVDNDGDADESSPRLKRSRDDDNDDNIDESSITLTGNGDDDEGDEWNLRLKRSKANYDKDGDKLSFRLQQSSDDDNDEVNDDSSSTRQKRSFPTISWSQTRLNPKPPEKLQEALTTADLVRSQDTEDRFFHALDKLVEENVDEDADDAKHVKDIFRNEQLRSLMKEADSPTETRKRTQRSDDDDDDDNDDNDADDYDNKNKNQGHTITIDDIDKIGEKMSKKIPGYIDDRNIYGLEETGLGIPNTVITDMLYREHQENALFDVD